jgi:dihydrofolate reductase
MSLDGFVAEPRQSAENPLGTVGIRLHQWAFPLAVWRSTHGLQGGEVNESNRVVEESFANIGATVMGRNMFDGRAGSWNAKDPWNSGAGRIRRFITRCLCSRITRPNCSSLEGGTTFTFVTGGIETALELALRAANGKDDRRRRAPRNSSSFDDVGDDLHGLELVRTTAAPKVTHLKFACKALRSSYFNATAGASS